MKDIKKIVTVGGGTGSFTVLSGLKKLPDVSLTALVSMADNGGSTGILMDELGVLPPGDVKQCLVALSEHTDTVRKLMNYRFDEGKLLGHSFGNIFLAALEKVTGNFVEGVQIASEILKVRGVVTPVTRDKAELALLLSTREVVDGQVNITNTNIQELGFEEIFYKNKVDLNENAKTAILAADYIIIAPGDYYCSIIPNLIVSGFKEAIQESNAKIILAINLTNKLGHTQNWNTSDYVKGLEEYLGKKSDLILVNKEAPTQQQIKRYKLKEGDGVMVADDFDDSRVVRENLISTLLVDAHNTDKVMRSFIRHDGDKLAKCINKIIRK